MKTFTTVLKENMNNIQEECEKLKNLVIQKYKVSPGIDYRNGIEVEWDSENQLFMVWVEPYSEKELYPGKTGGSESHPKGQFNIDEDPTANYDYFIMTKHQKNNDPACWIDHEKGHILGYRKGEYDKKGKPFIHKKVLFNNTYTSEWFEYSAFTNQIKGLLKKYGKDYQKIIDLMMIDYENSHHKGDVNVLRQFKDMFIYYLDMLSPNDDVVGKVNNQYGVKLNSKDTSTFDNYKYVKK